MPPSALRPPTGVGVTPQANHELPKLRALAYILPSLSGCPLQPTGVLGTTDSQNKTQKQKLWLAAPFSPPLSGKRAHEKLFYSEKFHHVESLNCQVPLPTQRHPAKPVALLQRSG